MKFPVSHKNAIIYAGITALIVVTFILTLFVLTRKNRAEDTAPSVKTESLQRVDLHSYDFILKNMTNNTALKGFYAYKERKAKWKENDIEKYWIPVKKIILKAIRIDEETQLKRLLGVKD